MTSARLRGGFAAVVAAALVAIPGAARADDSPGPRAEKVAPPPRPLGDPFARDVGLVEIGATAGIAGATLAGYLGAAPTPRWTRTNAFDLHVRDGLRLASPGARNAARAVSDFFLAMQSAYVVAVDPIATAWLGHGRFDVGARMVFVDLEAMTLVAALDLVTVDVAGRERPYGRACVGAAASTDDCTGARRFQSFFSGHSSMTFAAAGLTCAHHARMPLYGGGLADALACGGTVGVAAATATLRVAADQHWATDVLVGSAIGFAAGFFVPSWLHYRRAGADVAALVVPNGVFATARF
jgi:membrane-associated phospholipid phosphatase